MEEIQSVTACAVQERAPTPESRSSCAGSTESDLLQLLACDEVSVIFLGPDLGIRRMSATTGRLLGLGSDGLPRGLGDLAERLRCPELLVDARQALRSGEVVVRNLHLPEREMHLTLRFYPGHPVQGETDGLLLNISDATERWKANSLARHLAAIVKYSDDAILSKDLNGIITSWNNGAQRLFGYTAEETVGKSVTLLIPDGMPDEEPGILERIRRGEAIDHYQTVRRRKDGSLVDVSLCVSPMLDGEGRVIGASKIARDVTQEKRAERQREVLINELNHRVKNTLATVQSIACQSLRHATSMEEFADSFNARLLALSKTQDLLTTGNWVHASLRDLVLNELAPYRNEANTVRLGGDDVYLPPRMITAFGMLIHELTTNAVKYGALSQPGGHVDVRWQPEDVEGSMRLRFSWTETDGPPIAQPPTRRGMGTRLLETLVRSFGGIADLQFSPSGACCAIDIPLEKRDGQP